MLIRVLMTRSIRWAMCSSIRQSASDTLLSSWLRPTRMASSMVRTHRKDSVRVEMKSSTSTHATVLLDGKEINYDWIFLRDSCQCNRCIDLSTRQKLHSTADVPLTISPRQSGLRILNGDTLEIVWNQPLLNQIIDTEHRSLYSNTWLQTYSSPENLARSRFHTRPLIYWNGNDLSRADLHVHYLDYLHSDAGLHTALKHLNDYGLVFINNIPSEKKDDEEFVVERLVERIGEIRHTFYGKSWDVRSVEQAKNVAYTSQALGLHMDLLYFEAPPGLQFLHCLVNNVTGGSSYFVDSFRAAEILRHEDPRAFEMLCSYPITFHYRNANRHYHYTRPTVVLDQFSVDNRIDHINYSPPFQAPFESDTSRPEFRQFIRAFQCFRDLIEDKSNSFELTLTKGQCVIFHNRRVLHARRAFDASSGERWLKGSYTDLDNFKDRLRILEENFLRFAEFI